MTQTRYRPMLAKEIHTPFNSKDWFFEVKWDGFRAIAYIDEKLSLRSRNNQELLRDFPELEELRRQVQNAVLDGEIVILRNGKVDFQALLERKRATSPKEIWLRAKNIEAVYVVFDILEKDDKPLIKLPLIERKKILADVLKEGAHVLLADYIEEKGEAYYKVAIEKGLEGIVAKKKNSLYEPGVRSSDWLKIKKMHSADCVIFGYTEGSGSRKNTFGALIVGLYNEESKPVYIGKVGTGFTEKTLKTLLETFQKLKTDIAPFKAEPFDVVTWLKPELVCEVTYQTVTSDMKLRIAQFQRLRTDKPARECTIDQLEERPRKEESPLKEYETKRHFERTTEPKGDEKKAEGETKIFVIQEHHARRLHYDFRLERDGVLKSWAVPKGVPESSDEKRLAVETEDHPIEYAKFEGEIPKGEYGAGQVIIWDKGTYETKVWNEKMVEVFLNGRKLKGRYVLVPLKKVDEKSWLMLKGKEQP